MHKTKWLIYSASLMVILMGFAVAFKVSDENNYQRTEINNVQLAGITETKAISFNIETETQTETDIETEKYIEETTTEAPITTTIEYATNDETGATVEETETPVVLCYPTTVTQEQVFNLINNLRVAVGVDEVAYDSTLEAMATERAIENATNDWFVVDGHHLRPNRTPASTICGEYGVIGSFGEIMGRYQSTPEEIVTGWTNSASHYSAMVNTVYNRIGVGVGVDSEGYLYWVAIFMD